MQTPPVYPKRFFAGPLNAYIVPTTRPHKSYHTPSTCTQQEATRPDIIHPQSNFARAVAQGEPTWRGLSSKLPPTHSTFCEMSLAHQNRTIAIASDFCVDGAKSPEIPQKEGVSEIAAPNRKSLAAFHRTLKPQCGIALSCLGNR